MTFQQWSSHFIQNPPIWIESIWFRVGLVALGLIIIAVTLYLSRPKPMDEKVTKNLKHSGTGNMFLQNVIVDNGSTLAHTISQTINQAVHPELKQISTEETANPDGTQNVSILIEVVSSTTPGALTIHLRSEGILAVSIQPAPDSNGFSNGVELSNMLRSETEFRATIPSPKGRYFIRLHLAHPTNVTYGYEF